MKKEFFLWNATGGLKKLRKCKQDLNDTIIDSSIQSVIVRINTKLKLNGTVYIVHKQRSGRLWRATGSKRENW